MHFSYLLFLTTYVCPFSSAFSYSHTYESVTVENVHWYKCIAKLYAKNSHR